MLSNLLARLFGSRTQRAEQSVSLDSVIDDAIERHDLPSLVRLAPDIASQPAEQRLQILLLVERAFTLRELADADFYLSYSRERDRVRSGLLHSQCAGGAR